MTRRHPLPTLWLMTDERQGEALWPALNALPRGAGIVFRHFSLERAARRMLLARVAKVARRRDLLLVDGSAIAAVHNLAELQAAHRRRAPGVFVSPVFATRTHPGAATLGPSRFAALARKARVPVIALGGMDAKKFRRLRRFGAHGWAAIDALTPP